MEEKKKRQIEKKVVRPNQIHKLKELLLSHDPKLTKGTKEQYWYEAHKKNILERIASIEKGWISEKKYIMDIGEAVWHIDRQCEGKLDLVGKAPEEEKKEIGSGDGSREEPKPHGSAPIV